MKTPAGCWERRYAITVRSLENDQTFRVLQQNRHYGKKIHVFGFERFVLGFLLY